MCAHGARNLKNRLFATAQDCMTLAENNVRMHEMTKAAKNANAKQKRQTLAKREALKVNIAWEIRQSNLDVCR